MFPLVSAPPTIADSSLDEEELFYIRRMYSSVNNDCWYSVVVQNLKSEYGSTFGDKVLLYGALIWETGFQPNYVSQHYTFKSQFHKSIAALDQKMVSEQHFFAHVFAIWGSSDPESKILYLAGLLIVLKNLNKQNDLGVGKQPLRYLYHFVLLFLRRHMDFRSPPNLERQLYFETEGLEKPCTIPDKRITHGSLATGLLGPNPDPWYMLWSWTNDIRYLKATYNIHGAKQHQSYDDLAQVNRALHSIRQTIVVTLALPEVSTFVQSVYHL